MDNPGLAIAIIIALGAAAQWLAWRINLPAILPLLIIGFLLGPVLGIMDPSSLFGDHVLHPAVSLAVGLILFEGGLTLRWKELREIGTTVWRLVDRKSTRLNSSHVAISYAVFCLKKKK